MILKEKLSGKNIILASQSPRRRNLLKELEIEFEIRTKNNIIETYPDNISAKDVALYLAKLKSGSFISELNHDDILITADTVVLLDDKAINKPKDKDDAVRMINLISGNVHTVVTGVCISSIEKQVCFAAKTDVYFKNLSNEEILYYVDKYKPYDKAGAYGIQEWIGYIGIERIDGSYFNVMGLPVQRLYEELMLF